MSQLIGKSLNARAENDSINVSLKHLISKQEDVSSILESHHKIFCTWIKKKKSHSSENHGFELSCSRKSPLMVTHHRNITFTISLAIKNSQVQSFRCLCTTQSYWVRISPLKSWKEVSRMSTLKKMSSSYAKPRRNYYFIKNGLLFS